MTEAAEATKDFSAELEAATTVKEMIQIGLAAEEAGDKKTASASVKQAKDEMSGAEDTGWTARGVAIVSKNKKLATEMVSEVDGDCMFTAEFVACAAAWDAIGEKDKIAPLLEQALDFAMSGEEKMAVAEALMQYQGDESAAKEAFVAVLPDLSSNDEIMAGAASAVKMFKDKALAKQFYEKAEGKMTSTTDMLKLARAIVKDAEDKEYATAIYQKAAELTSVPADKVSIGAEIAKETGNQELADQYFSEAFSKAEGFDDLIKLYDAVVEAVGADAASAKDALAKAKAAAENTTALLEIAKRAYAAGDSADGSATLDQAENAASNLKDLEDVVAVAKELDASNTDRISKIEKMVERRKANAELYVKFQQAAGEETNPRRLAALADEAMAALDDTDFTRTLLENAETAATEWDGGSMNTLAPVIAGAAKHLADKEWIGKLYAKSMEGGSGYAKIHSAVEHAGSLEMDGAQEIAKKMLEDYISANSPLQASDICKVAGDAVASVGDSAWAMQLVEQSEGLNAVSQVHLAAVIRDAGDAGKADSMVDAAAQASADAAMLENVAIAMRDAGFDHDSRLRAYKAGFSAMSSDLQKAKWVEGLLIQLGDVDEVESKLAELEKSGDAAVRSRAGAIRAFRMPSTGHAPNRLPRA